MSRQPGKRFLTHDGPVQVVFHNKLSWFVSEVPEKNIPNMVVSVGSILTICCRGLCLVAPQTLRLSVGSIL